MTTLGEESRAQLQEHNKQLFYKNNPRSFHIYGRMNGMKRMKPVNKSRFVTNLIYADIYRVECAEDEAKLQKELAFLNTQGEFELREIRFPTSEVL